jgi:hypothetical protein
MFLKVTLVMNALKSVVVKKEDPVPTQMAARAIMSKEPQFMKVDLIQMFALLPVISLNSIVIAAEEYLRQPIGALMAAKAAPV